MAVLLPDWMAGYHYDEPSGIPLLWTFGFSFIYSFLLYEPFLADQERAQRRAMLAYEELTAQKFVDAGSVGVIGYCFGGAMGLTLARAGASVFLNFTLTFG